MSEEDIVEAYDNSAEGYADFYDTPLGELFIDVTVTRMQDFLPDQGPLRVLDLGCGHCTVSRELASQHDITYVKAIDISESMVQSAQQKLNEELFSVFDFEVSGITSLDFEEDYYDIVLLQGGVISYVDDPLEVLKVAEGSKKNDGLVFLTSLPTYSYALFDLKARDVETFLETLRTSKTSDTQDIPIRVFSNSEIERFVSKTGMVVLESYPKIAYVNHIEPQRREEVIQRKYEEVKDIELENSREPICINGLQNSFVLK